MSDDAPDIDGPEWLKPIEVARLMGVRRQTIYRHMKAGWNDMPEPVRFGPRTARFRRSEILAWLKKLEIDLGEDVELDPLPEKRLREDEEWL